MREILCLLMIAATLVFATEAARAQQSTKVYRIGVLTQRATLPASLLTGLRDLRYVEGKNLIIVHRWATTDSKLLPQLAEELVALKVDVIVAWTPEAIAPVIKATQTIPVVMLESGDPVRRGFVQSLGQPGGNVTGLSAAAPSGGDATGLGAAGSCSLDKRAEVIREILPRLSRLTLLRTRGSSLNLKGYLAASARLGIKLEVVEARSVDAFENAYGEIAGQSPQALITTRDPLTVRYAKKLSEFTLKSRVPWMSDAAEFVEAGGLISCGPNYENSGRRGAVYVEKILRGANPGLLPIEPAEHEFVVNLKTARTIGVTIPPHILLEANKVIK